MRFLFVLDNSYDKNGPTQLLTRRLASAIAQEGHTAEILSMQAADSTKTVEMTGVKTHIVCRAANRQVKDFFAPEDMATPCFFKIGMQLLRHPKWMRLLWLWKIGKRNINGFDIMQAIEQRCKQTQYDFVVSSSAPHYTSFALSDARIQAHKAVYMCDPYYLGEYFTQKSDYKQEKLLYQRVQKVFVTKFMYADYANSPFAKYQNKICVLALPGVASNIFADTPEREDKENGFIECVYVGNFYWKIRRPDYLLKLFCQMNHPRLRLKLVVGGPLYEFPQDYFDEVKAILKERFIMVGPLPYHEAYAAIQKADVLISLGNTNANMLPSKVFDCISFCKPVLNISAIENDPALEYFERYPLAKTIFVQEDVSMAAQKVQHFLENAKQETIAFTTVEKFFWENTPVAVARQFLHEMVPIGKQE